MWYNPVYRGGAGMERVYCLIIGYCFGMILSAEIVAKILTGHGCAGLGTGNPGMANVMSQLGFRAGLAVLAGDIAKTAAACLLCYFIFPSVGRIAMLYAGFGACIGHDFPVWRSGRGGKSVTTACVAIIVFSPLWGTLSCAAGMFVVFATGYLPVGAVVITSVFVVLAFLFHGAEAGMLAALLCLLMISRHYRGIGRVMRGEEPQKMKKFGKKKTGG